MEERGVPAPIRLRPRTVTDDLNPYGRTLGTIEWMNGPFEQSSPENPASQMQKLPRHCPFLLHVYVREDGSKVFPHFDSTAK